MLKGQRLLAEREVIRFTPYSVRSDPVPWNYPIEPKGFSNRIQVYFVNGKLSGKKEYIILMGISMKVLVSDHPTSGTKSGIRRKRNGIT